MRMTLLYLKAAGKDGIAFYTDQRVVISRWSAVQADPHNLPKTS